MDSPQPYTFLPALSAGFIALVAMQEGSLTALAAAVAVPAAAFAGSSIGGRAGLFQGYARRIVRDSMERRIPDELAERVSASVLGAASSGAVLAAVLVIQLLMGGFNFLMALAALPIAISPLLAVMPYINRSSERRTRLDIEYPFFMVFSAIMAYCGGTIYSALQQVKRAGHAFRQMSLEAAEVERKATLAGVGVIKGIEAHAETIPHENLSRALLTTTSVWRTGGDLVSTLDDLAAEGLKFLTDKFERFTSTVSALVEIFFTVLVLMPMGVSLAVLVGGQMSGSLALTTLVLVPMVGMAIMFGVRQNMPKLPNTLNLDFMTLVKAAALAAVMVAVLAALQMIGIGLPLPIVAATGLGGACILVYASMRHQVGEIYDSERELKRFLRVAVEERKAGKTLYHALKTAAAQKYRRYFNSFIKGFASRLKMGLGIYVAGASARSWLARVVFWLVDMVDRLGGASPELLEKVITLLTNYSAARESARGRIRLFLYITYATPFIISSMFGMIHPLIAGTAFGGSDVSYLQQSGGPMFTPSPEAAASLIDTGFLMMIVATAMMAFAVSYAVDMHPWGLHRVAIAVLLYIPAYYMLPIVSELTRATLFPPQAGMAR
ncbi:MAG: hypothetical protein QXM16_09340 [Nitrososphaerota archaeon]